MFYIDPLKSAHYNNYMNEEPQETEWFKVTFPLWKKAVESHRESSDTPRKQTSRLIFKTLRQQETLKR